MDKTSAQIAIKTLHAEASNLAPSAIIELFIIDVSQIGFDRGVISPTDINAKINTLFRFHSNVKLINSSIYWQGKEYIACPIQADGFEVSSKGTLPTPTLSLTVSDDGIPALSLLKERLLQLGDLAGAKLTRIRTFAKFLDVENFYGTVPPDGFSPNPNSEFPRDIFYVDKKSKEDKNIVQYELGSILDTQGLKLPGRLVISNSCPFRYRGEGCCYEYNSRRIAGEHGDEAILPTAAPPVATIFDERITNLLSGVNIIDKGLYDPNVSYSSGEYVYITHNNVNYYFVANGLNINIPPPYSQFWIQDDCSRKPRGCEYRYAVAGSAQGVTLGNLPYGGFLAVNRFK